MYMVCNKSSIKINVQLIFKNLLDEPYQGNGVTPIHTFGQSMSTSASLAMCNQGNVIEVTLWLLSLGHDMSHSSLWWLRPLATREGRCHVRNLTTPKTPHSDKSQHGQTTQGWGEKDHWQLCQPSSPTARHMLMKEPPETPQSQDMPCGKGPRPKTYGLGHGVHPGEAQVSRLTFPLCPVKFLTDRFGNIVKCMCFMPLKFGEVNCIIRTALLSV